MYHRRIPAQLTPLSFSEAMEARARQRAERKKEMEELKRKKEEEKLVKVQEMAFRITRLVFCFFLLLSETIKNATFQAEMKAAEEQRQREAEEEKHKMVEKKREEKRQEREVRCTSYFGNTSKNMRQSTCGSLTGLCRILN